MEKFLTNVNRIFNIINRYSVQQLMTICEAIAKDYYDDADINNASANIKYVDWTKNHDKESGISIICKGMIDFEYKSASSWNGVNIDINTCACFDGDCDIIKIYRDIHDIKHKMQAEMLDVYAKRLNITPADTVTSTLTKTR